MSSISFTTQELLTDFQQIAQEAERLNRTAQKNRWCGNRGLQNEFLNLQADFKNTQDLRTQAQGKGILSEKMDLQMKQAETAAQSSFKQIQTAFDQQKGNWRSRIFSFSIPQPVLNLYHYFQKEKPLKLTSGQTVLVEQFIQSNQSDWELNQKIVQDKAVVQELIKRKALLRRSGDHDSSLLVALANAYDGAEETSYLMVQKNKTLEGIPEIGSKSTRMKDKLDTLRLLMKTRKWTQSDAFYFYRACVLHDCHLFLDYALKLPRVELTAQEQAYLWLSVRSAEGAEFLKKIGCNPNIRHEGRTPLLMLTDPAYSHPFAADALRAHILIQAGADLKATALVLNKFEMNAADLSSDPYLKSVVKDAFESKA